MKEETILKKHKFLTSLLILTALGLGGANASFANEVTGIDKSLTDVAGDKANGKKVFVDLRKGNCLACHAVTDLNNEQFHGNVGPSLDGVAERYDEAGLRLLIVNSKELFPETVMPAFYVKEGFNRPRKDLIGKSILEAQEVEDVVAYLLTLKN